ncbi:MAG TPA: hypothetical protein VGN80_01605 [Devosiaceae bacterium]|jgi:hypothetical protein|nr:hypothetical protein [Devosiaceae bacterium]
MNLLPLNRRGVYLVDAVGSFLLGAAMILSADPLAALLGPALPAGALFAVGAGLLPWAAFNAWIGLRGSFPSRAVTLNVAGDGIWVLASLVLIASAGPALAPAGLATVGGLAGAVAIIGLIKASGLARAHATA